MYTAETRLFKTIRERLGVKKPTALPMCHYDPDEQDETWDTWETKTKKNKPVAYFITETLPGWIDNVDKFLFDWYRDFRYWFRNRFVIRLHLLDTGLERGQYYDLDHRILHANFNALKNFVEGELAWMNVVWNDEKRKEFPVPFYRRWFGWKNKAAGLDYLKRAMNLVWTVDDGFDLGDERLGTSTYQADSAREQWILYHWWENYQQMTDSHDLWHEFNEEMRKKYDTGFLDMCRTQWTQEEREYGDRLFAVARQVEEAQDKEIDEMLIRLMKIRRTLWT